MSVFKKMTAFLTAVGIAASMTMTGCGYNTRQALEVDGYSVPAGVFIYYTNTAYNQALSKLREENPDLDTTDTKAVQAATLEGKDVRTWIQDKATELCVEFVATEKKYDELGLTMSDEEKLNLDTMMDYYWPGSQEVMEKNGVSEASFEKIVTSSYKNDALFHHYYGIGGEMGVTEEELYDYYAENNMRVEYISFSLTDTEGNALEAADKAKLKSMVEDYQKRVQDALDNGGVSAVMLEMDAVKADYDAYQTSLTEEGTTEEATEAELETSAAETEAETEAAAETEAETEAVEETEAETEAAAETEAETEAVEETEAAAEETEAAEEETAEAEESEAEETEAEEATEEPTEEATEAVEETEAEEETEAATEAEETTEGETEEATEAATEELPEEETDPYANESIIGVINAEDYDDPSQIYYNPSEKTYNTILGIKEADYGKPYFVEEDDTYYLVVRYDINERMTEDDLWTESTIENTLYAVHNQDFEDLIDTWAAALTPKRNEAAYKRYDPFKLDFS